MGFAHEGDYKVEMMMKKMKRKAGGGSRGGQNASTCQLARDLERCPEDIASEFEMIWC